MRHQRGDVPGPTTRGDRTEERAAPGQALPAPLGYDEEVSENRGERGKAPDPLRGKDRKPSEGESPVRADAPSRGGGYFPIPGEDS